jgi:hypothetical protein
VHSHSRRTRPGSIKSKYGSRSSRVNRSTEADSRAVQNSSVALTLFRGSNMNNLIECMNVNRAVIWGVRSGRG